LLVGLTAQSLTVGPSATVAAYTAAAAVFASLLIGASFTVTTVRSSALRPIKMAGPAVKRFSGFVLLAVGVWFTVLAFLPSPIIGG